MKKSYLLYTLFTLLLCSSWTQAQTDAKALDKAAISIENSAIQYDGRYFSIGYPMGDVPEDKGVCTDVVIRAYRKLGIDLQRLVHEDMQRSFEQYPKLWGLKRPDANIDHRRVPNLMTFFSRFGKVKKRSTKAADYLPGDIVCWRLSNGLTHIGLVVSKKSRDQKRYMVIHNIGGGQVIEDVLFDYTIIGHYSY